MVPCWNKIISDPSGRRRSTVLKLFYFTRGSIMEISDVCLPAMAGCCVAITVHECSDWLHHCLVNIYAKIILFHFKAWFHVKIKHWNSVKFFKIILDMVPCWNKNILGWSTNGGGSALKFFKIILFWHGTTALDIIKSCDKMRNTCWILYTFEFKFHIYAQVLVNLRSLTDLCMIFGQFWK